MRLIAVTCAVCVPLLAAAVGTTESSSPKEIRRESVQMWSGACPSWHIFADAQSIYWIEPRRSKPYFVLWRMARSGGKPKRVSTECTALHGVDESSIYCSGYGEWWRIPFDGGAAKKLEGCQSPAECWGKYAMGRDLTAGASPLLSVDKTTGRISRIVDQPLSIDNFVTGGSALVFAAKYHHSNGREYEDLFSIFRVGNDGNNLTTLVTEKWSPKSLLLHRDSLFYLGDGNAISSVQLSGGPSRTLAELSSADQNPADFGPIAMTNDDEATYVLQGDYWMLGTGAPGQGRVIRIPFAGGASSEIASFRSGWPSRIQSDGTYVYVEFSGRGLSRVPKKGGLVEHYSGTERLADATVSADQIFLLQRKSASASACTLSRMQK